MATKTETLRAGLLASGWQRTETRSSRECYTKICMIYTRLDARPQPERMWLWLGTLGSLRWGTENAFTKSSKVGPNMAKRLLAAGNKSADESSDELLKELEA